MNKIFLICSERSGSNLIVRILNSHSSILGKSPNHLYRLFTPLLKKFKNLENNKKWKDLIKKVVYAQSIKIGDDWKTDVTEDEVFKNVKSRSLFGIIDYIYHKEAIYNNKTQIFIKEVKTYNIFDHLINAYPNSKFIFQVRDPRDMVTSWSKSAIHRGDIIRATNIWNNDQSQTIKILLNNKDRFYYYKYEDLIKNTNKVLNEICDFINLPFENKMLLFYKKSDSNTLSNNTDNWKNLNKSIISSNEGKYISYLNEKQIRFIEYQCKQNMLFLSYKLKYNPIKLQKYKSIKEELFLNERFNKIEYNDIDQVEKNKRKIWMKFYKHLIDLNNG